MTVAEKLPTQRDCHGHSFNADLSSGPYYFDGCDTLAKLFEKQCLKLKDKIAHREKDYGIWLSYSWTDFYSHARLIGLGLAALGLKRGEVVSINNFYRLFKDILTPVQLDGLRNQHLGVVAPVGLPQVAAALQRRTAHVARVQQRGPVLAGVDEQLRVLDLAGAAVDHVASHRRGVHRQRQEAVQAGRDRPAAVPGAVVLA